MLDATYQKDNNSNMLDGWVNQVWHNSNQMLIGGDVINVSQHAHEQKNKNLNDLIIYQRWIVWERRCTISNTLKNIPSLQAGLRNESSNSNVNKYS